MVPYIYIAIPSYGLMATIGVIVAMSYMYYKSITTDKYYIPFKDYLILCLFCIVGCLLGSKALFTLTQLPKLINAFSFSNLLQVTLMGGFVFYGGLFGALIGNILFSKMKKYNLNDIMDFTIPAFVIFHAFGRIGCFLSGCCYGFKLSNPLVIGIAHLNYFPIQLIEALFEFVMFFVLIRKVSDGNKLKIYLISYSTFRFLIEFFRGDEARGIWFGLSTSQWISIVIIILFAFVSIKNIFFIKRRN